MIKSKEETIEFEPIPIATQEEVEEIADDVDNIGVDTDEILEDTSNIDKKTTWLIYLWILDKITMIIILWLTLTLWR